MHASSPTNAVRRVILELVGRGHSAAEIRERLGERAGEQDLLYADSLVRVRDEVRSERLGARRVASA
jgi:hypothetical protein